MADDRLRELERRWLASDLPEDLEALNRERCRVEGHPGDTGGIYVEFDTAEFAFEGKCRGSYRRCSRCNAKLPAQKGPGLAEYYAKMAAEREQKILDIITGREPWPEGVERPSCIKTEPDGSSAGKTSFWPLRLGSRPALTGPCSGP